MDDAKLAAAAAVLRQLGPRLIAADKLRADCDRRISEALQVNVQGLIDLTRLGGVVTERELPIVAIAAVDGREVWRWAGTLHRYDQLTRACDLFR